MQCLVGNLRNHSESIEPRGDLLQLFRIDHKCSQWCQIEGLTIYIPSKVAYLNIPSLIKKRSIYIFKLPFFYKALTTSNYITKYKAKLQKDSYIIEMIVIIVKDVHHCKRLRLKDFRDHYGSSCVKSGLQSIINKVHPRNCYEFLFLQTLIKSHRTWVTEKVFGP